MHDAFRTFCLNSPQHGAWGGRYVPVPDHLHLFVSVDKISLSDWVKSLKNALSKTLRTAAQEGSHWQKGFFDHLLRSGESYSQKWDYVRENPVRAYWSQSLRTGLTQAKFTILSIANEDETCSGGL
jgi:hypothetical protein